MAELAETDNNFMDKAVEFSRQATRVKLGPGKDTKHLVASINLADRKFVALPKELFEGKGAELLSMLYCFASSETFREYLQDEEFLHCIEGPRTEAVLDLIYRPLNLEFWAQEADRESIHKIKAVLSKYRDYLGNYKGQSLTDVYLDQLRQGLLILCEKAAVEEEPQFGGVYKYFRLVGGLSLYKTIYYYKPEGRFESREYSIYLDSRTVYKVKLYSNLKFCGMTLDNILQAVIPKLNSFADYIAFDGNTMVELQPSTPLATISPSTPLILSELITNLEDPLDASTVQVICSNDPTAFFLVTFDATYSIDSVINEIKNRINELSPVSSTGKSNSSLSMSSSIEGFRLKPRDILLRKSEVEARLKQHKSQKRNDSLEQGLSSRPPMSEHDPNIDDAKPKSKRANKKLDNFKTQEQEAESYDEREEMAIVFAKAKGTHTAVSISFKYVSNPALATNVKSVVLTQIEICPSPSEILESYYFWKNRRMEQSESSAQVLIVEYPKELNIPITELCRDIKSKWLDPCPFVYYQLRGVVAELFCLGEGATVPYVRTPSGQWYSPYHDYCSDSLQGLDGVQTLIYEKQYENTF